MPIKVLLSLLVSAPALLLTLGEGCDTEQDIDLDADGSSACSDPSLNTSQTCDCRDDDPAINPSAVEIDDLIDNDCDGAVEWIHGYGSWEYSAPGFELRSPAVLADLSIVAYSSAVISRHSSLGEKLQDPTFVAPDGYYCGLHAIGASADQNLVSAGPYSGSPPGSSACVLVTSPTDVPQDLAVDIMANYSRIWDLALAPDGGFVVVGDVYEPNNTTYPYTDLFVVRLNADLDVVWTFVWGGERGYDEAWYAAVHSDGEVSIWASGGSTSGHYGKVLIRLDQAGNIVGLVDDDATHLYSTFDLVAADDGGVFLIGVTVGYVSVEKFGSDGASEWLWERPKQNYGTLRAGYLSADGSLVVVGTLDYYYYLARLSPDGVLLAEKQLPILGYGYGVVEMADGGAIVTGFTDFDQQNAAHGAWAQMMRLDRNWNTPPGTPNSGL